MQISLGCNDAKVVHIHFLYFFIFVIQLGLFMVPCLADKELQCLVCRSVVEEIEDEIKKANPRHTIEVGGFHLEANGNPRSTKKKYALSEMHMHDVLENVCSKMDDYAQAKFKDSGRRTILKLVSSSGKMHDDVGKVDFIPDDKLNANLKYLCEGIIDEFEDDIVRIFTKQEKDPDLKLCARAAGYCPGSDGESEDYEFEREEL